MMKNDFTKEELERYSRHFILPEFGREGQKKLKEGRVLVVGCGGLGCPLLQYLVAAGVGKVGIVDFDVVDSSNLQRQILYGTEDVGRSKVEVAAKKLHSLNPLVKIIAYNQRINSGNVEEIISDYDVVADGTDNFATRYLINDVCVLFDKINVFASIFRFEGQLSVFNMRLKNNTRGPNYRDIFPDPPPPDSVPNCAEGGIIGVLAGIMGCLQAGEVIKVLAGIGEPLSGKLMIWDGLTMESRILKIEKNADNPVSGGKPTITTLIDYDQYCGMSRADELAMSCKIVSPLELRKMIDSDSGYLIDVREPNERDIASIGGVLIPAGEVELHVDKIPRKGQVVIYCRSGERSRKAIEILEREYGYENIYNLEGGILAWAEQVDKSMAKY